MSLAPLIAFEGIDGSGKSTQIRLLKEYLKQKKVSSAYFKFPRHGTMIFGQIIDDYLMGEFGDPARINPYMASILYAADRGEAMSEIDRSRKTKKVVIVDRYTGSNQAHQLAKISNKAKRQDFLAWLHKLEYEYFQIPQPDKVLYLRVPFQETREMLKKEAGGDMQKLDGHERDVCYLKKVAAAYDMIAKNSKRWHIIECGKKNKVIPKEEIAEKIRKVIDM